MSLHAYWAYGLCIHADLVCPELPSHPQSGLPPWFQVGHRHQRTAETGPTPAESEVPQESAALAPVTWTNMLCQWARGTVLIRYHFERWAAMCEILQSMRRTIAFSGASSIFLICMTARVTRFNIGALYNGTTYTIALPANGLTDMSGNALANTFTSTFTTTTDPATCCGNVVSTAPGNGASGVPTNPKGVPPALPGRQ